ncbi:hypothetical protein HY417_02245 [Candidatus Kaiserbacteria bacterium]|nr:hypothetical protein [Candidatus Kaiserbacteria bacterium]
MTWKKASLVLVVAGIFDLVRAFFNMFWFFGPALGAWYCTSVASGWVGSLWGLTAAACAGVAVKAGIVASVITVPFGVVMADATALFGYLTLGMLVLWTNMRILKTIKNGVLKFSASAGVSAIPIISALPLFTFTLWRLYRTQIRLEKEAFKKWEKENAATQLQQRNQQAAYIAQIRGFQQTQVMRQEAVNDNKYTPQQMDRAA